MSVDIAWETITSGADGDALSEKVRDFVHTKFQQIDLPRFINSVHVHSFEFGSVPPQIEIKDICNPLPDFYEDEEEDGDENEDQDHDTNHVTLSESASSHLNSGPAFGTRTEMSPIQESPGYDSARALSVSLQARLTSWTDRNHAFDTQNNVFPRNGTPGIPGGTSNISYFHLPRGGFSGAQTPLAALAGGTPFSPSWQYDSEQHDHANYRESASASAVRSHNRSDSVSSPGAESPFDPSSPESRPVGFPAAEKVSDELNLDDISLHSTLRDRHTNPSDLQVVARVNYDGNVHMTLTAEILLDYPMPSFVGIPLKLSVTGMKFDGIAIIASIRKRMHFCFLDPDDAQTLVGDQILNETPIGTGETPRMKSTFGSLLREVQIESEIGRQEKGKQALKNVGKVEKFVLEQVKKIFEEEFVFPSFWTFLV